VFLPWALGTMHVWSQVTSFCLGLLGFGIALRPRHHFSQSGGTLPTGEEKTYRRSRPIQNLIRFPLFWLGLAFLVYVLIQALNPAWKYCTGGGFWWLQKIDCVRWLPAGMRVPFAISNPWRSLMIYTDAWLLVNTLWIGFTRRRSLQILFIILAVNGFVLAVIGIFERLSGNGKILWFWDPPASYFVSTFIYKNHAACYFNLILAVTVGLAYWYFLRSRRQLEKSSPTGMLVFFVTVVSVIILFSGSRAGMACMIGFLLLVIPIIVYQTRRLPGGPSLPVILALIGLFSAFVIMGFYALDISAVADRVTRLMKEDREASIDDRELVTRATFKMAEDNLACGWGVGCYRYYFPVYQVRYPELIRADGGKGRKLYWEHAHNDYVETLAEVGLVGVSLLALLLGGSAWLMIRARVWKNPLALFATLGLVITVVHSAVDFNFQNPAILLTWCALVPAIILWAERDKRA
jgi:O-antigen ligase